jgi:biopolymer transport protein ExbD
MADFQTSNNAKNKRRNNLRIDLTPMVDLGFLLITFFIFTTSMSDKLNLEIIYPNPNELPCTPATTPSILHLVLDSNNTYYTYANEDSKHVTTLKTRKDIYATCIAHQQTVASLQHTKLTKAADSCILILQPSKSCVMQNIITVMDVITDLKIKNYTIEDVSDEELQKLRLQ